MVKREKTTEKQRKISRKAELVTLLENLAKVEQWKLSCTRADFHAVLFILQETIFERWLHGNKNENCKETTKRITL